MATRTNVTSTVFGDALTVYYSLDSSNELYYHVVLNRTLSAELKDAVTKFPLAKYPRDIQGLADAKQVIELLNRSLV